MEFWNYIKPELIKTAFAFLTLAFGWFIGQRIIAFWDIRKKRQELDIGTATQFHKLYGEFKEVSRLWRTFTYTGRGKKLTFTKTVPLELLRRAAAAEGGVEAIIVKLATERRLKEEDIETLGLFRQAYQKLREAIRAKEPLEWTYNTREYTLYNNLAGKTACIISTSKTKRRCKMAESPKILQKITKIQADHWKDALNQIGPAPGGKSVS